MIKLFWKDTHKDKPTNLKEWNNPLLPIFYTFKILGRLPFEKGESGELEFRLLSAPSAWALVATSLQVVIVTEIFITDLTNPKNWTSFNLVIATVQNLIILNTSFHAFTTWLDTPAITRAFNKWLVFHKRFYTIVKHEVVTPILNHSFWGIIGVFFFSFTIFIESIINQKVKVYIFGMELKEAIYCICVFYFTIIVWCWVVFCLTVKKAAEIFKEHILQTLSRPVSPEELAELRSLWVEFHACAVDMSEAIAKTVMMNQITGYMMTLLSLYAGLIYLLVDHTLQLGYVPHSLIHSHISCILVYTLGHFAQQSMTENTLLYLYSKRWQYFSAPVKFELDLLLDAIEMSSPCFELRGHLTMDRRGYIDVLNRILTYLIILMQIKVSADSIT